MNFIIEIDPVNEKLSVQPSRPNRFSKTRMHRFTNRTVKRCAVNSQFYGCTERNGRDRTTGRRASSVRNKRHARSLALRRVTVMSAADGRAQTRATMICAAPSTIPFDFPSTRISIVIHFPGRAVSESFLRASPRPKSPFNETPPRFYRHLYIYIYDILHR